MTPCDVVLCHPVRTAIGTYGGSLKDLPAPDLGAVAIRETVRRAGLAPPWRRPRSGAGPDDTVMIIRPH